MISQVITRPEAKRDLREARDFRRILLHRFPYALFYHVGENRIIIVAVLHQARNPETLESRQVE